MNILNNKKIAIVGGGPGGLTLARLLQMNGANVQVYERDVNKDVRVQGATLDLHDDSGLKALRTAGLIEAFKDNYRPGADKLCITDKNARIVWNDHVDEKEEQVFKNEKHFRPEIDRGPLRKILLDSLQPNTVVWDSNFVSLLPVDDKWELTFKNGSSAIADIVIAADGANSKIRPLITPIKPFFAGMTMVEGAVYHPEKVAPGINRLLNGGKIFAVGDEKTLIVSSKGDGSLVFYTGCNTEEQWVRNSGIDFTDKAQVLAWFQQEFAGWDPIWLELFENVSGPYIPRPQYCMPVDQQWTPLPNLTMLGDAAHLMPPYAGEGVNMAMLDALELSECLTNGSYPDVYSAIASFEKQMCTRAAATAQMTLDQTASLHSHDGLTNLVAMFNE